MKGVEEIGKSDILRILEHMERDGCKYERLGKIRSSFNLAQKKGGFEAYAETVAITKLRKQVRKYSK